MVERIANNFVSLAEIAIHLPDLRAAVREGTVTKFQKRQKAMFAEGEAHGEAMRQQAAAAKRRALANLPDLLEQAEANLIANGFKVLWAVDAAEANQHVLDIAKRHNVKTVTKSKSMLTEELFLNRALENSDLQVVETDLGEYIVQLEGETPSHITSPVMHKTRAGIRDIFVRKLGMPPTDDAGEMVAFVRRKLREDFIAADMGITGGNFLIAETGSIGLVMNEGNGRMVTSMPDVHVALVGIEKVVATLEDYATLTQVLPRSGSGQKLTVYTNIINGPRRENETDGAKHVYVILVDNGRSDIYSGKYAEALTCIRCGACQNACPVYRSVGGHAYGAVYAGPIGAVISPLLNGLENASPLPNASSLCGACKQICPVDIDLPRMLLDLRHDLVQEGIGTAGWRQALQAWAIGNSNATLFEMGGKMAKIGQRVTGNRLPGVLGSWQKYRDFPDFADKSFRQLWREREKKS